MQQCNITIYYSKSEKNCGKLTLEVDNQVVLNKVPVVVPSSYYEHMQTTGFATQTYQLTQKHIVPVQGIENSGEGLDILNNIKQLIGTAQARRSDSSFTVLEEVDLAKKTSPRIMLASGALDERGQLLKTQDFFAISPRDFLVLRSKMRDTSVAAMKVEKSFLLFPAPVSQHTPLPLSLHQELGKLSKLSKPKSTQAPSQDFKNRELTSDPRAPGYKYIKPAHSSDSKHHHKRRKRAQRNFTSYDSTYDTSTGDDAFDILWMYHYPKLAPIFRPDSALSWYFYLNSLNNSSELNEETKQRVEKDFCEIQGLQGVNSCKFEKTIEGYKIHLYSDDNRQSEVGELKYNSDDNCYKVVGQGHCLNVDVDSNGVIQAHLLGANTSENSNYMGIDGPAQTGEPVHTELNSGLKFEFKSLSDNEYAGNWRHSDSNGIEVQGTSLSFLDNSTIQTSTIAGQSSNLNDPLLSSVLRHSFDSLYEPASPTLSEPTAQAQVTSSMVQPFVADSANSALSSPSSDYVSEYKIEPPPPPPPPPEVTTWSNNIDSYSYNSGMSP